MPGTGAKTETNFNSQPRCCTRGKEGEVIPLSRFERGAVNVAETIGSRRATEIGESRITERRWTRRNRSETSRRDEEKPAPPTMARQTMVRHGSSGGEANQRISTDPVRTIHRDYNASRAPIFTVACEAITDTCVGRGVQFASQLALPFQATLYIRKVTKLLYIEIESK